MTIFPRHRIRVSAALVLLFFCALAGYGQQVKRIVIVKVDGLPYYYLDQVVRQRDRDTGKSVLPWINEVFYKNGTRVPNFYTRGMSLSAPSWSTLDTGQHLQLKGNVEFDRFTLHPYDYLNMVPFYYGYMKGSKIDTPGVEVLDRLKIPLVSDAFPLENKYTSLQLYQRGFAWGMFAGSFVNMIPRDRNDMIDEWTLGFDLRSMTVDQNERDVAEKIVKYPQMDYFDYYFVDFDHVSHHNNDDATRIAKLRELDRAVGHIWTAIQNSSRASETAMVIVSDHGFNSTPKVYSQGFNLVKLLASAQGGGHHVITKRFLLMNYSLKSIDPFASMIRTSSNESYYLKGQADKYPTALVDFDGNERSSIHLRNSDINLIHLLLLELKKKDLTEPQRLAAAKAVVAVIEKHRAEWQQTLSQTNEEVSALVRWAKAMRPKLPALPTAEGPGVSKEQARSDLRLRIDVAAAEEDASDYRKYIASISRLLAVTRDDLIRGKFSIEDLVAPDAMGDGNTIYELQNYVVGLAPRGLQLASDGSLDMETSFTRVDYPRLLVDQRVRNNVQDGISNRPVDFVSVRVPLESVRANLPADAMPDDDPVLMYAGADKQVLILTREHGSQQSYRYLPVANFRQGADSKAEFNIAPVSEGLPLHYFEDPMLNVAGDRRAFFDAWHSEVEWLHAVHRCTYSNAIIGLNEQMDRHPFGADGLTGDAALIQRFRERQRGLTEADILVEASNHWNFDVRGFNPGGNHGSFFRVSTNSTFMIAGGSATGIPRGLAIEEPYDSLSFAPTIFALTGKIAPSGTPTSAMRAIGFRAFPGRIVTELVR